MGIEKFAENQKQIQEAIRQARYFLATGLIVTSLALTAVGCLADENSSTASPDVPNPTHNLQKPTTKIETGINPQDQRSLDSGINEKAANGSDSSVTSAIEAEKVKPEFIKGQIVTLKDTGNQDEIAVYTVLNQFGSQVRAVDRFGNDVYFPIAEIKSRLAEELPGGLNLEIVNKKIAQHFTFDSSIQQNQQEQGRAMILDFVLRNPSIFPDEFDKSKGLDLIFGPPLLIKADSQEYRQGYYNGGNRFIAINTKYFSDLTNFTTGFDHELVHAFLDPGFHNKALNEIVAEAISDRSMNLTPDRSLGVTEKTKIKRTPVDCSGRGDLPFDTYVMGTNSIIELDHTELPGLLNLLLQLASNDKIYRRNSLSDWKVSSEVEKYYATLSGDAQTGIEKRKLFDNMLKQYCTDLGLNDKPKTKYTAFAQKENNNAKLISYERRRSQRKGRSVNNI